jgi:hypothetical protein
MTNITKISALSPKPYVVESGIPISPKRAGVSSYPFASMKVGDSFAISDERNALTRVRAIASLYGTNHPPMKFSVRMTDPHARTYRCWRIA